VGANVHFLGRAVLYGLGLFLMRTSLTRFACSHQASAQPPAGQPLTCRIESIDFEGWQAQQLSNSWVKLIIVPHLGGRVMQVVFDGHSYLFVNPKYKGQYFPPSEARGKHRWFNYGGDKIWPMPEGDQDEHHWPGPISDPLDDGNYAFKILAQSSQCSIRLDGPPDPKTGLQYSREISMGTQSPQIRFHAIMKNIAGHPIQWSMQSVTQYDTNDPRNSGNYNREFWAFAPANPNSAYLESYHVRAGLADDPSFRVEEGLFSLHWLPLENEVWLDSLGGWLAVADASSGYGIVERFRYFPGSEYPGKATVIFYKNGSSLTLDDHGSPMLTASHPDEALRYMEAEINSPIVALAPGETYAMDTEWFPARMGKNLIAVTDAGVVQIPLAAVRTPKGVHLSGLFGAFFPGRIEAWLFDAQNANVAAVTLQNMSVNTPIDLHEDISAPANADHVSLHLIDAQGNDRGAMGNAKIRSKDGAS
jgi:hypothetical protein